LKEGKIKMKIRYYSHASFQIIGSHGTRLLLDPWLYNPIYGNMIWQFPECPIPIDDYINQDILSISHEHPDHFCPKTLAYFPRNIKIIIRNSGKNGLIKQKLNEMNFTNIIELNHRQSFSFKEFNITQFWDYSTNDSALVIANHNYTVFHQNDCMLSKEEAEFIGNNFNLDAALLFYSSASIYPTFFDMPEVVKHSETLKRNDTVLERAAQYADSLNVSCVIPCAGDCVYFRLPETDIHAGSLPIEFKEFASRKGYTFEVLTPLPGDIIDLENLETEFLPSFTSRLEWIEKLKQLRQRDDIKKITEQIEKWEEGFQFEPEKFSSLFSSYCNYVEKHFDDIFQDTSLRYGVISVYIRAYNSSQYFRYIIKLSFGEKLCQFQKVKSNDEPNEKFDMQLDIQSKYLGMVTEGALNFDDLKAGMLKIKREGSFSKVEAAFWHFLSTFYPFIFNQQGIGFQADKTFPHKVCYVHQDL
jgi:L-ascorbate metabolism protein UlaG (beta-lactamase superfamily)